MERSERPEEPTFRRLCRIGLYAVGTVYVLAAILMITGAGRLVLENDGPVAIFLLVIGLPWSFYLAAMADTDLSPLLGRLMLLAFPAVNLAILWRLCRRRRRRRRY